ncbi:geranylgeranyl transferase type-1 subunit beta-like [Dendronephthya gigantea]|uniref:geranylgeranyl transferase type-1 subunit beta-like n=1 Tax=Dendronephthya gigantea TaxID=151771 RepID=UPI00106C4C67|nr:geranylgeranyl transferase type-1 subunit beta-like [Dendronephthya gigantea]
MEKITRNMTDEKPCVEIKEDFLHAKHVKFFIRCLNVLPSSYSSLDTTRLTIAFFAISGLDILNALDVIADDKSNYIDWIYSLQILSGKGGNVNNCGFKGSSTLHLKGYEDFESPFDSGHIAMTYVALASLLILGDDLSRVDKKSVVESLKHLQLNDGSFCATADGSENDMRFIFCACSISYMLNDWSGVDADGAVKYIQDSLAYEHGFAQGPFLEAVGGSSYCALAALVLMGRLETAFSPDQLDKIKKWCIFRQKSGFHGRPNKPVDTCYSFWVGASLKLLGCYNFVNSKSNREFLMSTQAQAVGGFSKWPDGHPDALHSYFGACGLALMDEPGLQAVYAPLNISQRAANHLHRLHMTSLT